ncbi:MAG: DUF998 domain-containing protein, partial [Candidatus Thorarchaeota archaeon]
MSIKEKISNMPRMNKIGFFAPFIALIGIVIAIAISPNFTWWGNALSDLGHYTRTDLGSLQLFSAIIFNTGLITTGLMMLYFSISLFKQLNDPIGKIGLLIFMVSCMFLIGIGVLSENFGDLHFFVSVGFFLTFPFAFWTFGLSWLRFPSLRWFAVVSLLIPFVSLYIWIGIGSFWVGVAIPEIITAMSAIVWAWIVNNMH